MRKTNIFMFLVPSILILNSCIAASSAAQTTVSLAKKNIISETISTSTSSPAPSPISTATMPLLPTPEAVLVTAVKGNVFIRRGPDLAYNAVSVLMDGQSATARARDVLAKWIQISIPGHPKETGWISIQTHFAAVSGDVMTLPEIAPMDWPMPASLRNCTYHQMMAEPGEIIILALNDYPDNEIRINPGIYTIHDIEVDGNPEVMEVEVKEGSEIEIRDDGDGNHKKCAVTP